MESEPIKAIIERIAKECREAGTNEWETVKIIKHLTQQNTINKETLRKKTIEILQKINPKAGEIFESFNTMKVRTTQQEIESFDRGNITKSLLKETSIPRSLAEKISTEVEDKIKDLKIKHLNTSLIRAMVDVKLLEYGLESIHKEYTRIGMPIYEVTKKTQQKLFENKEILTEYNLMKIIPIKLGDSHLSQEIHINNLADFSTKPQSHSFNEIQETEDFTKSIISLKNKQTTIEKYYSQGIAINSANFLLYKSIQQIKKKNHKKNAQQFIELIKNPTIGINLFQPTKMKEKIEKEKIIEFGINLLEEMQKQNLHPTIIVDSKYKLKLLKPEIIEKGIKTINSETTYIHPNNNTSNSQTIMSSYAINIEKTAIENAGKENKFLEETNTLIENIKQLKEIKLSQLEKKEYLKSIDLTNSTNQVQLINLFNASMKFLQKQEIDKETIQFSEKTIQKTIEQLGKDWEICMPKKGEAIKKFNKANQKIQTITKKNKKNNEIHKNPTINKHLIYEITTKSKKETEETLDNSMGKIISFNL